MLDDLYPGFQKALPNPAVFRLRVFSLPPGSERYEVQGCGAILLRLEQGDHITIANTEGGQPCELISVDEAGRSDPDLLGTGALFPAKGLQRLLSTKDKSLRSLRMGLDARGFDVAQLAAAHLFETQHPRAPRRALPPAATAL